MIGELRLLPFVVVGAVATNNTLKITPNKMMKRIILLALSLVLTVSLNATLSITSGGKYYFVCDLWESGSMMVGSQHSVAPFIY